MKLIRALFLVIAFLAFSAAQAQVMQVNANDVLGTVMSPTSDITGQSIILKVGLIYDVTGTIYEGPRKGQKWHQQLTVQKAENHKFCGVVKTPDAGNVCRVETPFCGEVRTDGMVMMDSRGENVIRGCERTWVLKPVSETQMTGTMLGPNKGSNPDGSFTVSVELVQ